MRVWTQDQRLAAAERIRTQKPWLKSTGPRTPQGKAVSRNNAFKHGNRSAEMKAILQYFRDQRAYLNFVNLRIRHIKASRKFRNLAIELITPASTPVILSDSEGSRMVRRLRSFAVAQDDNGDDKVIIFPTLGKNALKRRIICGRGPPTRLTGAKGTPY